MNSLDENIKEIVANSVEKNGFLLIELVLRGTERNRVIEVYIDGEKDISADDCALVSRDIEFQIEKLLSKYPNYRLDVSSPGLDRPLKFIKQYLKHIGRKFEITYKSGDETKSLKGKLAAVEDEYLTFISNNKEVIINFNKITKAKVQISFS